MLSETVFRSDELPAADRFDCWRELVSRTHAPLELRSDHRADFRASQRVLDLGAVSVWPTTFQPVCFRRSPKLIRLGVRGRSRQRGEAPCQASRTRRDFRNTPSGGLHEIAAGAFQPLSTDPGSDRLLFVLEEPIQVTAGYVVRRSDGHGRGMRHSSSRLSRGPCPRGRSGFSPPNGLTHGQEGGQHRQTMEGRAGGGRV
jgi:hypothetical protein